MSQFQAIIQTRGSKDRRTDRWIDRPYFIGIFQLPQRVKKIFRTHLRLNGPVIFGQTRWSNKNSFGEKKKMLLMYLWSSLVKKAAKVDIEKTKYL